MESSSPGSLHTCASRRRSSLLWFFLSVPSPADWSTESNMENGRTFFSLSRKKVSPSAVVEERGDNFQKGWHNCRDKSPVLCNIYHSACRGCFLHPSYPCTKGPWACQMLHYANSTGACKKELGFTAPPEVSCGFGFFLLKNPATP